jgi:hypothetical protein
LESYTVSSVDERNDSERDGLLHLPEDVLLVILCEEQLLLYIQLLHEDVPGAAGGVL